MGRRSTAGAAGAAVDAAVAAGTDQLQMDLVRAVAVAVAVAVAEVAAAAVVAASAGAATGYLWGQRCQGLGRACAALQAADLGSAWQAQPLKTAFGSSAHKREQSVM